MTTIPYSTKPIPTIGQLRNVNINPATLVNGQVVSYNSTTSVWENTAGGGGGGGAVISGTDDAVVFKNGSNGDAVSNGITKNTALNGYTASVDTTNKRLAINHTAGAISETLEVNGTGLFTDGIDSLKIDGDKVGLSTGINKLRFYNRNLITPTSGLVQIDSQIKQIESSSFRSYDPDAFDTPNTTDLDSIYKIKLEGGTIRQTVATPAFDIQEAFRPLSFPTGQIVEYSNKLPLQKPIIISRNLGPQTIAPATVRVVTSFGLRRNAPFFDDGMTYDPCNMRAKLTGVGWNSAGAPVVYRVADLKLGFTISWNIHGTWVGGGGGLLHRGDVYVVQYRNGVILYNHLVQQLEQEGEIWFVGKKTFLGWDVISGEDFDPLTDYYEVELANQGGVDLTYNSAQVEIECWLAQ
jgi:hypothetical protein